MALTRPERERIIDSKLKIQSAADSLKKVSTGKIPDREAVEECLETVEKSLHDALQSKPGSRS
jgi:hypothetical protein